MFLSNDARGSPPDPGTRRRGSVGTDSGVVPGSGARVAPGPLRVRPTSPRQGTGTPGADQRGLSSAGSPAQRSRAAAAGRRATQPDRPAPRLNATAPLVERGRRRDRRRSRPCCTGRDRLSPATRRRETTCSDDVRSERTGVARTGRHHATAASGARQRCAAVASDTKFHRPRDGRRPWAKRALAATRGTCWCWEMGRMTGLEPATS
jgi:hypothetical protein